MHLHRLAPRWQNGPTAETRHRPTNGTALFGSQLNFGRRTAVGRTVSGVKENYATGACNWLHWARMKQSTIVPRLRGQPHPRRCTLHWENCPGNPVGWVEGQNATHLVPPHLCPQTCATRRAPTVLASRDEKSRLGGYYRFPARRELDALCFLHFPSSGRGFFRRAYSCISVFSVSELPASQEAQVGPCAPFARCSGGAGGVPRRAQRTYPPLS